MPMDQQRLTNASILADEARIPEHVVYRAFVRETVVLNLQTGKYHGLNPTAGRMFELLDREATVQEAAIRLADEYTAPLRKIEGDVCDLVRSLVERGLIELNTHRNG